MKKFLSFLALVAICYGGTQNCEARPFNVVLTSQPQRLELINIDEGTTYDDLFTNAQKIFSLPALPHLIFVQGPGFGPMRTGEDITDRNWDSVGGIRQRLIRSSIPIHDDSLSLQVVM